MVGYEPDLNPKNWKKRFMKFLLEEDYEEDEPDDIDATLSTSSITPCNTLNDDAGLSTPYHLRKSQPDDYKGCSATPLIQVFSVRISTDFDDGKPCEIYGSIRAFEESYPRFDLYARDPEDSETISKDGTLSLIGPEGGAIIPSLSPTLDLCLNDRIRGVEVVNGRLNFNPISQDSYDRLLEGVVQGAHGSAYVYYVVFQFAQYGIIQVTVTENDHDDENDNDDKKCNVADIYGSIVIEYENGRMYCSGDDRVKWLETRHFDKPADQPMRVLVGTPIKLSRNAVAVPAYSSITIKLNLWDSNGKIASDCLQFPVHVVEKFSYIRTQYACVVVRVTWHHAYFYLYKDRFMEDSNRVESSNEREMQKKSKILYNQHRSASIVPRNIPRGSVGYPKVEVFTVFVAGIARKISALCGAIRVDDGSDKISIYNRDDSCPEMLSDNSLASIDVNYRAIMDYEFGLVLYLRDPVGKLEVSRGYFGWNSCSLESYMPWFSKRLCSVVQGNDGYAAVHYAVFKDAFEAFVEVKLFSDGSPDIPINLFGTLFGRYSGYDYSTSYQQKYYMSRLFDQPRDRPVELKVGSPIAMLKSIVVVPNYSSLFIEANLGALGIDGVAEPICGMAEFKIDVWSTIATMIRGEHYWIEIYVKFKV